MLPGSLDIIIHLTVTLAQNDGGLALKDEPIKIFGIKLFANPEAVFLQIIVSIPHGSASRRDPPRSKNFFGSNNQNLKMFFLEVCHETDFAALLLFS